MVTILLAMSFVVLLIHFFRRDYTSPSVFAATAVLAACLGGNPAPIWAEGSDARTRNQGDRESNLPELDDQTTEAEAGLGADQSPEITLEEKVPDSLRDVADVRYPDRTSDSPEWLAFEDDRKKWSDEKHEWVVVHAPVEIKRRQAREVLDRRIVEATNDYLNNLLGSSHAARRVGYTVSEIRDRGVVDKEFVEQVLVSSTSTPLFAGHALLKFDKSFGAAAAERWRAATAATRLLRTGAAAFVAFLVLGILVGYFRVDTATRGYYTRRLQLATAGTILAIVAASVLAAKWWVPWM